MTDQQPRRSSMAGVQNVVLVHGGFVDGSGWRGVYDLLTADGFNVSVVQNQTLSLESDVETTHNVLDQQDGPAILVGHSYGGAEITEAAWRSKPSWYLTATDDRMIPPPAQGTMSERIGASVVEQAGSHSIYVSKPRATADLI